MTVTKIATPRDKPQVSVWTDDALGKVPQLPIGTIRQPRDDKLHRLVGAALMSPAPLSARSSCASSQGSSRRGSFCSDASTAAFSARSVDGQASRRTSKVGSSETKGFVGTAASAASKDLRHFSKMREPKRSSEVIAHKQEPENTADELLLDLKGGNGRRKKRDAQEEVERRTWVQAAKEAEDRRLAEEQRRQQEENEEWLKKSLEDNAAMIQHQEESSRLAEIARSQQKALDEAALLQTTAAETRRKRLQGPQVCASCDGSGKCKSCSGTGCITVFYLSSVVDGHSQAFHGRTSAGCKDCGGRCNGSEFLGDDILKGNGCCAFCRGAGMKKLSVLEVVAAMKDAAPKSSAREASSFKPGAAGAANTNWKKVDLTKVQSLADA